MKIIPFITLVILLGLYSCSNLPKKEKEEFEKIKPFDPAVISEILPKAQRYLVNCDRDTVIVTENGSMIYIDSLTFGSSKSSMIHGVISVEIIEAISLSDILRANLSTITNEGILESDGMIFINAFQGLNQLAIREGKEILIDLKNENQKANMLVWTKDVTDNTDLWKQTDSTKKYLKLIDLENLDFSVANSKKIIIKSYGNVPDSLNISEAKDMGLFRADTVVCGISKEYITMLKAPELSKTLIATREFEYRMQWIHRTCDVEVLQMYLSNLNLNLWEIDFQVYKYLQEQKHPFAKQFERLYKQKMTKVKEVNIDHKSILRIKNDFEHSQKSNDLFYQFSVRNLGWYNIDKYWKRSDMSNVYVSVEVPLNNIKKSQIDISIPSDKVVMGLSKNKENKHVLNPFGDLNKVKLPIGTNALITGIIVTKNKQVFSIYHEFKVDSYNQITVKVQESSFDKISDLFKLTNPVKQDVSQSKFSCCLDEFEEFSFDD